MRRPSLAKTLRRTPTAVEVRFWRIIHPIRQAGWHFRKQAPIGRYVVDFVCHSARLIVEIDGDSHYLEVGITHDAVRTGFLVGEGYRVLRFTNIDVMENPEAVYLAVLDALGASGSTPSRPPPIKGEVKVRGCGDTGDIDAHHSPLPPRARPHSRRHRLR